MKRVFLMPKIKSKTTTITTPCCNQTLTINETDNFNECPFCGDKYFDKPPYEYKLFKDQDEFLKTRDFTIFWKDYDILKYYAANIILKNVDKTSYYYKDKQALNDGINDIILIFLNKYKNNSEFRIDGSFYGCLDMMSRGMLWGYQKKLEDMMNHFSDLNNDENNPNFFENSVIIKSDEYFSLRQLKENIVNYLVKIPFEERIHLLNILYFNVLKLKNFYKTEKLLLNYYNFFNTKELKKLYDEFVNNLNI